MHTSRFRFTLAPTDIASVRILRLAFGTAASLWFSQAVAWQLSFIAPALTMFILALPIPALRLKGGIGFVVALSGSLVLSLALLPRLLNFPMAGFILLVLALFWSFYYTARGGSAVLGTLLTAGISVATAVGTVSIDGAITVIKGLSFGAVTGVLFVWIAHAFVPDSLAGDAAPAAPPPKPAAPDPFDARWNAFRSLMIVLPVAIWFLFSSNSAPYIPVMIKVAAMGQQATTVMTRAAGRSLVMSTVIGGIGAIIGWQVLRIVPTLSVYTIVIALAALFMGSRIFRGKGLHPDAATWSYALLTMIVILAPAVLDSAFGNAAGPRFVDRLVMFALATAYAVFAVYVFDAFRPRPARTGGAASPQ